MRRSIIGIAALIVVGVVLVVAYLSIYVVDPTKQALVLRFGQTIKVSTEPGLYFKLPLVDNVIYIERRLLDLDSPPLEVIASDQKRLVVDAFARYRVTDSLLFYQTVGSVSIANSRLAVTLNSAVRRVLGEASFTDVVRDIRAELTERITQQVNSEAASLGVEVVDVRIRRADLPAANSQAVYDRMKTERQREATEIRAQGDEAKLRITARADRDVTVILAEANSESEEIRGAGDAEANRIFATAYSSDPDFFGFYRSMQAYQQGLQASSTTMIMSPDSDFFRYFSDIGGTAVLPDALGLPADFVAAPSTLPAEQPLLGDLPESPILEIVPPLEVPLIDVVPPLEITPIDPAATPIAPTLVTPEPAPATPEPAAPVTPAPVTP